MARDLGRRRWGRGGAGWPAPDLGNDGVGTAQGRRRFPVEERQGGSAFREKERAGKEKEARARPGCWSWTPAAGSWQVRRQTKQLSRWRSPMRLPEANGGGCGLLCGRRGHDAGVWGRGRRSRARGSVELGVEPLRSGRHEIEDDWGLRRAGCPGRGARASSAREVLRGGAPVVVLARARWRGARGFDPAVRRRLPDGGGEEA